MEKLLGQGTFGQVVKCVREDTREVVAIKVIKNQQAFYQQVLLQIRCSAHSGTEHGELGAAELSLLRCQALLGPARA